MTFKLLVVDDAVDLAEVVAFAARMAWPGCEVIIAGGGEEGIERFTMDQPDLVVLDVAMPPPDGFEILRRIRTTSSVPVLMLTVRDATIDKVRALDLGADDYLIKPFDHLELLARLRALARRANSPVPSSGFACGDLVIDFTTHQVTVRGEVIRLTTTEYRLLEELARHAGTTLPHAILLERVWGPEWVTDPGYLKVFIRRLRRKLGDDAAHPRYIQTDWGLGYRLAAPAAPLDRPQE